MNNLLLKLTLDDGGIHSSENIVINNRRLAVLAVLFLYYIKAMTFVLSPQFWAEDGPVFFSDAWTYGWGSITRIQAGYYVIVIRIIALIATFPPIKHAALICSGISVVIAALPIYLILSRRSDKILPDFTSKMVMALIYLVGPGSYEIYGNITNLQWFLPFWTILFIFSAHSPHKAVRILEYIFLLLASLTGPFVVFIFPIYVILLVFRQVKLNYAVAILLLITFALQSYSVFTTPQAAGQLSIINLLQYIGSKLTLSGLLGIRGQRLIFTDSPTSVALIVGVLLWIYASARLILTGSAFTRVMVIFGNLVFVAGCRKFADYFGMAPEIGARYGWFAICAYLYGYYYIASRTPFKAERILCYALLVLAFLIAVPLDLFMFNPKNVDWKNEVKAFRWLHTGDTLRVNTDPIPWNFPLVKKAPSEILKMDEGDNINSFIRMQIRDNKLESLDDWAFIVGERTTGNQVCVVLKSADNFYVIPASPQHRPEVSELYKQDYNWSGFTFSKSLANVVPGKYSVGIFIYNINSGSQGLRYLTHNFVVNASNDSRIIDF